MRQVLFAVLVLTAPALAACGAHDDTAHAQDSRVYECPMHCKLPGHTEEYTQRGPGDCPVCHMHLRPRSAPAH